MQKGRNRTLSYRQKTSVKATAEEKGERAEKEEGRRGRETKKGG